MRGFGRTLSLLLSLTVIGGCQPHCTLPLTGCLDYSLTLSDLPDAPGGLPAGIDLPDPATVNKLDRQPRFMSLYEAIALALEQGTIGSQSVRGAGLSNEELGFFTGTSVGGTDSIRVLALEPAVAGAAIEGSLGRFDANWFGQMNWTTIDEPQQGLISFSNGMSTFFQTGLAKPLATGGVVGTTFSTNYNLLNNPPGGAFSVLNPSYTTRLQLGFEQPLWRNSGVAINQLLNSFPGSSLFSSVNGRQSIGTGIVIARLRFEQQQAEFERRVNFMLLNVEAAYWNLYAAYVSLYSNDMALRMAYEVWRITNENYNVGKALPEKLYGARGQYELFRANRLQAVGRVLESERTLRQLLGMPVDDGYQLIPTDAPTVDAYRAEWKSALYDALTSRPELELARMDIKAKELELARQGNFLRPDVRFQATYTGVGLGTRLDGPRTTVDAAGNERFSNSLAVLGSRDFNNWNLGLTWNTPLGYRVEHALMRQAKLQLAQSYIFLKEQETKATALLAKQYSKLAETYQQIEPRRVQRENFGKQVIDRLEIYAKFGDSKMPLDFLQSSVSQWANALTAEYQTIVDYNVALAAFEFAKGTLMRYDNVTISEGPLPECVQVRAVEHERARSHALLLRERPVPIMREATACGLGLPRLPRRGAPALPALMEGCTLATPPMSEGITPPPALDPPPPVEPASPQATPELLPAPRPAPQGLPEARIEQLPVATPAISGPLLTAPPGNDIQAAPATLGTVRTEPP